MHAVEKLEAEQKIKLAEMNHDMKMQQVKLENDIKLEHTKKSNEQEISYLNSLHTKNVNLTQYLVAKEQGGPTKWIKIDTETQTSPQVHLHDNQK